MKTLTDTQNELYTLLKMYMTTVQPMHYDRLKNLCEFKTFDSTFNALLSKGYIKRYNEGDGDNTYILAVRTTTTNKTTTDKGTTFITIEKIEGVKGVKITKEN